MIVIPNLPTEGGQERDLMSARANNAVRPRLIRRMHLLAVPIAFVVFHSRHNLSHPPAFTVRVTPNVENQTQGALTSLFPALHPNRVPLHRYFNRGLQFAS